MVIKKLDELKGNEVLAKALTTLEYQIILPENTVIKLDYIDKLKEFGIKEVYIKEESIGIKEIVILKADVEYTIKNKVRKIMEKHTYRNNKDLAELIDAADNIISTILEEKQVIEQIYDIKQRSSDIYEHSVNICSTAILISLKLGINKEVIHHIGVGCLLHDIGLRYQTSEYSDLDLTDLSEQDLNEYKKHPVYGYVAIKNESWLSNISKDIILLHHETLDGCGFPLHKIDLPIEVKIVSICDVFDELICGIGCKRVKVHEAVEYLTIFKDIKFDRKIAEVLLSFTATYPVGTYVRTNENEVGIVIAQNAEFNDRPVLKIIKDKNGNFLGEEIIKNLIKVHNIFIEEVIEEEIEKEIQKVVEKEI